MTYGKGSFDPVNDRGYWSGAFTYGMIPRKTTKNSAGNYILNNRGQKYLDNYEQYFDDGIKY